MKINSKCSLINRWATNQAISIKIVKQTKHSVQGILYFKTLAVNKIAFSGILSSIEGQLSFVSFSDLFIHEYQETFTLVLRAYGSEEQIEVGKLNLWVSIFDRKNFESIITKRFVLSKTNKPLDELKIRTSLFNEILIEKPGFLN